MAIELKWTITLSDLLDSQVSGMDSLQAGLRRTNCRSNVQHMDRLM
jgi:hypothetical protein